MTIVAMRFQSPGVGITFMLLAAGCFALSDAVIKHLGAAFPVLVLLWTRYLFQAVVMCSMQLRRRPWRTLLRSASPKLQTVRALILICNASCSFFGLQLLPLAECTALTMLGPLASTLLASVVLRERVTKARWALVLLGFVGMLIIVRPGTGRLGWPVVLPLSGAMFFAGYQIVTNKLSDMDDMVTTNLWSGLVALALLCAVLAALPIDLMPSLSRASGPQWLLIGLLGVAATSGQMTMVMAIRHAPISVLTPFGYVQIGFAALIGWAVFRQAPDLWASIGMALIAAAGVVTVWLNARGVRPGDAARDAAHKQRAAETDAAAAEVAVPAVLPSSDAPEAAGPATIKPGLAPTSKARTHPLRS